MLGPFDNTGKTGFDIAQGPETDWLSPSVWERTYAGKDGRQVRWRVVPPAFPYGWVDAGALLRPRQPICAFFATHASQTGLERRAPISLWVGTRGAFRLFYNGVERLSDAAYRGHDFDRRAATVWLEPGDNTIVLKVCGEDRGARWSRSGLRTRTARPIPSMHVGRRGWGFTRASQDGAARPPLAAGAAAVVRARAPARQEPCARRGLRALPGELRRRRPGVAPGAGPGAFRGSGSRPCRASCWRRKLAEDRNERADWITRARAELPRSPRGRLRRDLIDVLLAEAELLEHGLSPQAALPLYEQVLALDPDDITALSGKARSYDAAGLKQSALSLVEAAVKRNPHGVALLNMYTSGLGELGRAAEARASESQYSALRFDDPRPTGGQRRPGGGSAAGAVAEHWLERLQGLSPDSTWAAGIAARAQRAFAQPERALAEL